MALGFYSGLRNRETRIRQRKELLADKKAANEQWNARFKLQNEEANKTWLERNTITHGQDMSARDEERTYQKGLTAEQREYQAGLTAEERAYQEALTAKNQITDFNFWKLREDYSATLSEQKAINTEGRLQAWDQKKFERNRTATKEDLISRVTFENAAERTEFDYRFNKETAASEKAAITKHASEMQQILFEKVTGGKAIGTDFNAAVGGSSNPMAQIAQYSAGITALGVKKDNPVLAKLAGLNNPVVMKSVFEKLQKYHTQIIDAGNDDKNSAEIFREGANSFLSSIIITSPDPSQAEAIIKQMESIEGARPLDDLTKSIIGTSAGMGSGLIVKDLSLKKTLSISELGQWKEAIAEKALNRARNEASKITRGVRTANDMSKSDDPDTQALGKELALWLAGRGVDVNEAVKDATGDNADFLGVTILYGNSSFEEARSTQPLLRDAFLPDYLKNPSQSAPIEVPNRRVLKKLSSKEFGIIKEGDLVKLRQQDGTFVTFIYGGE